MSVEPLGMPRVLIEFQRRAEAVLREGDGGIVALALREPGITEPSQRTFSSAAGAEKSDLSAKNKAYIGQAFLGGCRSVIAVLIPTEEEWAVAYHMLETMRFTVCAFPGMAAEDVSATVTWIKEMATAKRDGRLFVLANADTAAHQWIVNFATSDIWLAGAEESIPATEYTARIAGLIAGVAMTQSITYSTLSEVEDVPHLTHDEMDTAVKAGKVILFHDGEKVKVARGVTSLVAVNGDDAPSPEWRKIQIVRLLNLIQEDIRRTIEDAYIGKVVNTAIHRGMLVSDILDYLHALEERDLLSAGTSTVEIDVTKMREYLKTIMSPEKVDEMDDDQVRAVDKGDHVFLSSGVQPLDSIENVDLDIAV